MEPAFIIVLPHPGLLHLETYLSQTFREVAVRTGRPHGQHTLWSQRCVGRSQPIYSV